MAGIGTEVWQNPGNIVISDPVTVTLYHNHRYTNYLQGTQYGFTIPDGAEIRGIEVNINRMISGRPNLIDNVVSLIKAGAPIGDNKAVTDTWPTNYTVATYGVSSDLWGSTWVPSDINSDDFGVVLAAYRDNNGNPSTNAYVDSMQITVYFSIAATTTVGCGDGTPVVYGDSITCVVTVTYSVGDLTPSGTVNWTTDVSGTFDSNPCTLEGADGISTCSVSYTPTAVLSGTHTITALYNGDEFFNPNNASGTMMVIQRPVTVTADAQTKAYGDLDPEFTYQITEGTLVFSDTLPGP